MRPRIRTATILIVDDEDEVREVLRRELASQGHVVLEARNGLEALHMVRTRPGIQLVLADVIMPFLNGAELAATIVSEFPSTPIVLMSAYASAELTRVGFRPDMVPMIQKPFRDEQLQAVLDKALKAPATARRAGKAVGAVTS